MQTPSHARVDYLRISITDRCNQRCLYCMPEGFSDWQPRSHILSYEEILQCVRAAVGMGFRAFRITGGEPLVRRDVTDLVRMMSAIEGVESIGMSTNASRLAPLAGPLRAAGLDTLNISLDALEPSVYRAITRQEIAPVLEGIEAGLAAGFRRVKLNTVLMRGMNEGEIWPLVRFAADRGLPLRFIELMPVSISEILTEENFLPAGEVMDRLARRERLIPLPKVRLGNGPARYYRMEKTGALVGFIGAITDTHFCESCNKIRLTSDGKIRPCLGHHGEHDLKPALRTEGTVAAVQAVFRQALAEKPPAHLFLDNYQPGRIMTAIGG